MIDTVIKKIKTLQREKGQVFVAIDGRCGAGKTTLAQMIENRIGGNVFHMDDFFLQPWQRTSERLNEPGGNVDRERFLAEVLLPLKTNQPFSFRPYNCSTQTFDEEIFIHPKTINIIEGSYSCHPKLMDYYDLHVFLDVKKEKQLSRIIKRVGEIRKKDFEEKWIPLEEIYFQTYNIAEKCEIQMEMNL